MGKKRNLRDGTDERETDPRYRDSVKAAAGKSEEYELKLEINPSCLDALLVSPPFDTLEHTERSQASVYFDTPDLRLNKLGFSLRVRTIGIRRIQTIKAESAAAAGLFVRPEWEREIDSAHPAINDSNTPFSGLIAEAELAHLKPVFSVDVTRRTVLIEREDAIIEAVLDRGEIVAGGSSSPINEVELELKSGSPVPLFGLARELDKTAPVRLGVLTKSERGYMLGTGVTEKPVKTGPLQLRPEVTTAEAFQTIVGSCLRQFRLNEAMLLRSGNAGALHQARVALRRLRSALSTFKPVVQDDRYDQLRAELKWIAAELGEARNLDVLIERVGEKKATQPLQDAREHAYAAVQVALASARLRGLMLDMAEWLAIGPWTSDRDRADLRDRPIEAFAAKALDKHRRRLKRLGKDLDLVSDEERHHARIEAKKLRYATEFFGSLFLKKKAARRYRDFHEALAALQAHLGDLNDLATAPLVISELGLADSPIGVALEPDVSRRVPLIKKAAEAYAVLMKSKRFWR